MKRMFVFFFLGLGSLLLAMTLAAETVVLGPLLMTITLFSWVYSLVLLYQAKPKWGREFLDLLAELLTWPT